ncbi:hypothetical protein GPJ56_004991 [Histomonas meleagridis]|uniref:uncharacterized protein n=1 Tax=Histomonas meleagridis TaxID=135588 RepID=UPI003559ED91|nr:hypothetical protein GPJ56_004991 [Histomonas meleagridis]KAH0802445.1 hypothetical protein GO595_004494 [Histomonas meleagridis]
MHKQKYLISSGLTPNSIAFTTVSATYQIEISDSEQTHENNINHLNSFSTNDLNNVNNDDVFDNINQRNSFSANNLNSISNNNNNVNRNTFSANNLNSISNNNNNINRNTFNANNLNSISNNNNNINRNTFNANNLNSISNNNNNNNNVNRNTFSANILNSISNNNNNDNTNKEYEIKKFLAKIPSSSLFVKALKDKLKYFALQNDGTNPINQVKINGYPIYKASIVYSGFNKRNKSEILSNNIEDITKHFYNFLKSIGKIIDISNKFSFIGVLKGMLSGDKSICWEDDVSTIYFQVAPFLKPDCINSRMKRWDYIRAWPVLILWNENPYEIDIKEFKDFNIKLHIVLQMVNNGFVRVHMEKDEKLEFGLFYNDILIPKCFLGNFIRLVIINAEEALK